ncbi:voltage-gated purine nucleotide uniporter SLC17A9-like isoform X4 [Ptychodera flava]|uniref:voltage-gated purine nucleotide uniporter SLC17A9-like isoform X4 n=1 Tax=Ptychodera flava TaxID=63121 RepID=UPI00396A9A1F
MNSEELLDDSDDGKTRLLEGHMSAVDPVSLSDDNHGVDLWNRRSTILWGAALFTLTALTYACRNCMPISAVAMSTEFGWDKSETGLVLSSFFWGYVTSQILSGVLSDRYGGDQVVTMASMIWGPLTIIYPFCAYAFDDKSSQLAFIVVNRVIFGVMTGFHYPTLTNIAASRVVKQNRSFFYTVINSGTTVGNILSGSVGSLLLGYYGWHVSFYLFGTAATVTSIAIRILLMGKRCLHPCTRIGIPETNRLSKRQKWTVLFKHRAFWAMVTASVCITGTYLLMVSWLPTYFEESFPGEKGWVFNVLPWAIAFTTEFLGGWVADRLIRSGISTTATRKFLQTLSSVVAATAFIFVGQTKCYITALALVTWAFVIGNLESAAVSVNPVDLAPAHAGAVYGFKNTCGSLMAFFGVYMSGHLLEYFQSWTAVFTIASCMSFIGWFVFVLFGTGERIL